MFTVAPGAKLRILFVEAHAIVGWEASVINPSKQQGRALSLPLPCTSSTAGLLAQQATTEVLGQLSCFSRLRNSSLPPMQIAIS